MLMRHWQLRDQNSLSSQRRAHARCCAVCGVTPVHVILEARDLNNRDPSRYLLRETGPYPVPEFQATHDRRSSLRHTLTLIMRNKFSKSKSKPEITTTETTEEEKERTHSRVLALSTTYMTRHDLCAQQPALGPRPILVVDTAASQHLIH